MSNNNIAKYLMNKGNARQRQLGKQLARGRVRGLSEELSLALSITDKLIKDFGAAAPSGAMTGADANPGNVPSPPRRKRKSRLNLPHE